MFLQIPQPPYQHQTSQDELSIVLIILIGLIVHTSNINTKKYYLKTYEGALKYGKAHFHRPAKSG